jgi:histidinol-phosphate/aromatic aminotransferase/cobyric acid decarboxylase-like protein
LLKTLTPYTAGEQPKDKRYIKLNTNENAYPPSERAAEIFRAFDFGTLRLYPDPEASELKEVLAKKYGIEPQNIFVGNGSDEILGFCFPAFFDADGEPVLFPDITYSFYPVYADLYRIPYRTPSLKDDYTIDIGDYIPKNFKERESALRNSDCLSTDKNAKNESAECGTNNAETKSGNAECNTKSGINSGGIENGKTKCGINSGETISGNAECRIENGKTKCVINGGGSKTSGVKKDTQNGGSQGIIIANPNAPTGILFPVVGIRKILEANPESVVIIDEAYADFSGVSVVPLVKEYENLLVVRTFSKSYSLAGIRCGYAIGQKPLIDALKIIKNSFNSYTLDSLTIKIAAAACADAGYYDMINERIMNIRDKTKEELRKIGFIALDSSSNFLFVKKDGTDGEYLFSELKKNGILTRRFKGERTGDFIRVTVGTETEMKEFVRVIEKLV